MRIIFKKIPKLALLFYFIGFIIITTAMLTHYCFQNLIEPITLQQVFIGGAIIIVIGSIINTIYQFNASNHSE